MPGAQMQLCANRFYCMCSREDRVQGFNQLKAAFPGRINRSHKEPDVREPPEEAVATSDTRGTPSRQSLSDQERDGRTAETQATVPPSTATPAAPQFDESRIRRFEKILAPQIVDLAALQEVCLLLAAYKRRVSSSRFRSSTSGALPGSDRTAR